MASTTSSKRRKGNGSENDEEPVERRQLVVASQREGTVLHMGVQCDVGATDSSSGAAADDIHVHITRPAASATVAAIRHHGKHVSGIRIGMRRLTSSARGQRREHCSRTEECGGSFRQDLQSSHSQKLHVPQLCVII